MFQIEPKGLDELQRHLKEAEKIAEALSGALGTLRFDPNDPTDVQQIIVTPEAGTYRIPGALQKQTMLRHFPAALRLSLRGSRPGRVLPR